MTLFQQVLRDNADVQAELAGLEPALQQAAAMVVKCLTSGHRILACGNGGSASDATHLTTEWACRFVEDRRPYPAISLTANGELMTAIGNDYGYDEVFARQVRAFGQPGDVLIALTTSGQSKNVVRALEEANDIGMESLCFLGRDGGFTKGVATLDLIAPGSTTARIQEAHKLLYHVLCELVEPHLAQA